MTEESDADDNESPSMYFEYDGLAAYRDAHGFMIVTTGGDKPVVDLKRWLDNASPVSKAEFERLKANTTKG